MPWRSYLHFSKIDGFKIDAKTTLQFMSICNSILFEPLSTGTIILKLLETNTFPIERHLFKIIPTLNILNKIKNRSMSIENTMKVCARESAEARYWKFYDFFNKIMYIFMVIIEMKIHECIRLFLIHIFFIFVRIIQYPNLFIKYNWCKYYA